MINYIIDQWFCNLQEHTSRSEYKYSRQLSNSTLIAGVDYDQDQDNNQYNNQNIKEADLKNNENGQEKIHPDNTAKLAQIHPEKASPKIMIQ